jgi:ABC-type transporter Mla subunit MlaD
VREPDPEAGEGAEGLVLTRRGKRLVGLALIGVVVVVVILGVTKPDPLASAYRYWAVFNTVQGLGSIDRDIRVAGVKVGTVGQVHRVGDDVKAELVLSKPIAIHQDARADMRPHTLFEGSDYVDLHPGSPSTPLLRAGATIPLTQTTNYVTLDQALRVLRPQIRNNLRQLAEVGSKTLRGEAISGIQRTLKQAPALTKALAPAASAAAGPHRTELAGAVSGIARTVDALAAKEDQLGTLPAHISDTAGALAVDGGAPLGAALDVLPGTLQAVYDESPTLTALIDEVNDFADDLTPALPNLRVALHSARPVLHRATPVLRRATPLIHHTRQLAKRLGAAGKGGLTKMLVLLNKPLPQLTDTLEVFNADSRYGEPGYHQLVAGAFSGADAMFRSYQTPAQNRDAPGHMWRTNAYVNPEAVTGLTSLLGGSLKAPYSDSGSLQPPACTDVATISKNAARQLEEAGACR